MKKLFLLLLILIVGIPVFPDSKYFILPELVLFGEEQFYLLPFPLKEQAGLTANKNIQAAINENNSISYINQMKIEQYPNIYTLEIPEKIDLIDYYLTNTKSSGFMDKQIKISSRKENSITFRYSPYYSLYSNLEFLSEYNLWNYSIDFTGEYNAVPDIFYTANNVLIKRNGIVLPLELEFLYSAGFSRESYINNVAESSLKLKYSYRKLDIISALTGLATYSNCLTGTAVGNLKIEQHYTNLLPSLSVMGAVWNSPNEKGYKYAFTVYPAYRINELKIGAALRVSSTDFAIYPSIFYRIKTNKILDISLYAIPELAIERGLEKYLVQNVTSETFLPVNNFEKFGIMLSELDKYGNSGSFAAEILHGNFIDLRQNNVNYTADTILNITLDYSQTFNRWFYGEITYKFQEELGYPLPVELFSLIKPPSQVLYLKAQFDFIKIPLRIIINTSLMNTLLLGESFKRPAVVENRSTNECSAWFVFKPTRHYDFGMIFTLYLDKNKGTLKFENSFFLKSKKIKVRS